MVMGSRAEALFLAFPARARAAEGMASRDKHNPRSTDDAAMISLRLDPLA